MIFGFGREIKIYSQSEKLHMYIYIFSFVSFLYTPTHIFPQETTVPQVTVDAGGLLDV